MPDEANFDTESPARALWVSSRGSGGPALSGPSSRLRDTLLTRVPERRVVAALSKQGPPSLRFFLTVRGGIGSICYAGWSVELWAELVAVSIGSEGETDFPAVTASGGDGDSREDHGFEAAAHKFRRVGVALGASSYPFGHPTPAVHVETRP